MEKFDRFLTFLSYSRRVLLQLTDLKNIKYAHLIFRGFTPDKGYYYDFDKYGYKSYITDTNRYLKTVFINYNNREIMHDKYGCYLFLSQFTDKTVPIYGLVDNGDFFLLKPYSSNSELFTLEKKLILKPRKGRGGQGVKLIEISENKFYVNGKQIARFEDACTGLKDYILNPFVEPHIYSSTIYPDSLNTVRLLSCVQDGKARIITAAQRFGVKGTGCVDNFSSGGLIAPVDLSTGKIGYATMWDNELHQKKLIGEHPDTAAQIVNVKIPNWDKVKNEMIELHESIKFIKYVGWDIAITPDSFRIIEANYASDLDALQLQTPLLIEEADRKFFAAYA